jgi:hypothetical protein
LIEKHAHSLDATSKRHLQKLADAAQLSFLCRMCPPYDENRLLFQQNNESKCRKLTKPTMAGKAKVRSYEDIIEAQAKRAAKEAAKRSRQRKRGGQRNVSTADVNYNG